MSRQHITTQGRSIPEGEHLAAEISATTEVLRCKRTLI